MSGCLEKLPTKRCLLGFEFCQTNRITSTPSEPVDSSFPAPFMFYGSQRT